MSFSLLLTIILVAVSGIHSKGNSKNDTEIGKEKVKSKLRQFQDLKASRSALAQEIPYIYYEWERETKATKKKKKSGKGRNDKDNKIKSKKGTKMKKKKRKKWKKDKLSKKHETEKMCGGH